MRTSRRSGRVRRVRRCPGPRATRALAVPARPWERVHLDMLSVAGGTHLVVVDAHSKWVEWAPLADGAGTEPVLRRLSEMLGRFGLPRTIVTDNATPFTSARFRRYCEISYYTGAVATTPSFRTPQAAYEHYNGDESDDDYTFVKCSPMLMTERGRRKSKPRQHEARIVRTKGSLPKIAARS
ncbi:Uncharacterized protein K02A2.6 [Eumeta japonica]|uniref:Uncharacterized protein K02A2.6 n=1 Tax=Eumeta variegata TaxID=151549 RepID=A0A4C1U0B0_EUMVA|nr:Uncharacterized protein K02A2.6 [Eumeta japonica]